MAYLTLWLLKTQKKKKKRAIKTIAVSSRALRLALLYNTPHQLTMPSVIPPQQQTHHSPALPSNPQFQLSQSFQSYPHGFAEASSILHQLPNSKEPITLCFPIASYQTDPDTHRTPSLN